MGLMGITGLLAVASLGLLVKELSDKPLITQPLTLPQPLTPVVFNNNNTVVNRSVAQPQPTRKQVGKQPKDDSGSWIDSMLFDANGIVKNQHYKFDGVTQSGKTTLAEYIMSKVADSIGHAEYLLIDPKHLKAEPSWSIKPYCSNIDDCLESLTNFADIITERQQSDTFNKRAADPIFLIIDEWDWIWTEYGKKALKMLRILLKVGAELRCFVILLGQSPLCGDATGLNTSDFEQTVRISIGRTATKVLSLPAHYPYSDRDDLKNEAEKLNTDGARFALVQQHGAKATLELIPSIDKVSPEIEEHELDIIFKQPIDNVIPLRRAL
jgi:hypothetical protein